MKKIIGLLVLFNMAKTVLAVNVNWSNATITGSGTTLTGSKMSKDNADHVYYIGSDRKVYYIDVANPSYPVTNLSALCSGTIELAASYSDLLVTSPWQVFYVGLNNRLMNYWHNGTSWVCTQVWPGGPNVLSGTGISVDEYNRIHYIGSDSRIYQLTYTSGPGWTGGPFPLPAVNPRPYSDLVTKQGHVFYQGTDMKLYNYYWTNTWNNAILNPTATNALAGSNIEVDENGRISYIGSDAKAYYMEWNSVNGWVQTQIHSSKTAKAYSAPRVQLYEGKIFFVDGVNNTISFFFKPTGGGWDYANIYFNGSTATSWQAIARTDILVTNNGDVVYGDADNKIHILRPILTWNTVAVLNGLNATFISNPAFETSISRLRCPVDSQFYARNASDWATVPFEGSCWGFYNMTIRIDKAPLASSPSWSTQTFSFDQFCNFIGSSSIHAELSEYSFSYKLNGQTQYTSIARAVVCGDAYLVSGQSNTTGDQWNDMATYEAMYGVNAPGGYGKFSRAYSNSVNYWCNNWGASTAQPVATNQCMTSVGTSFALALQYKLQQAYQIPTCVIHNGIGAQEISRFLNPPGHAASELFFDFYCDPLWHNAFKGIQNHMIRRVYETGLGNSIKGFIWYQGEGDVSMSTLYKGKFKQMYDELIAWVPSIPRTYLVQIHSMPVTSAVPADVINMSEMQRTMASHVPYANIRLISANGVHFPTCAGIHFDIYGYIEIADRLFSAIKMDFYGAPYSVQNLPPDIIGATIDGSTGILTLQFNQTLSATNSDNLTSVLTAIKCNNGAALSNPILNNDKLTMTVSNASGLTSVSYLGSLPCNTGIASPSCPSSDPHYDPNSLNWWCPCYLRNQNGIAALSFGNYPVTVGIPAGRILSESDNTSQDGQLDVFIFPNPVNGTEINLSAKTDAEQLLVNIYDLTGRVVSSSLHTVSNGKLTLQHGLKSGIYLVEISDFAGNSTTQKIVVNSRE